MTELSTLKSAEGSDQLSDDERRRRLEGLARHVISREEGKTPPDPDATAAFEADLDKELAGLDAGRDELGIVISLLLRSGQLQTEAAGESV